MNQGLLKTMRDLKANPAAAVELYPRLFDSRLWALVTHQNSDPNDPYFLMYESADGVQELPVFTGPEPTLAGHFGSLSPAPRAVEFDGRDLWPRLLKVLAHGRAQVAVDPGSAHGIRLTRSMILGMVNKYGGGHEAQ